jgi:mono/diheme cytochrome c family protein
MSRPLRPLAVVALTLLGAAVVAAAAGAAVVAFGLYDVAADRSHTQPVYTLLERTMERSVRRQARTIETPPGLDAPALLQRGALCYRVHCVQCHGAPGVSPQPIGLAAQPLPGPLVDAAARWRPRELYWITRHGVRMSGMPAWGQRLADDDLWALVGFVAWLPRLTPAAYDALQTALPTEMGCEGDGGSQRAGVAVAAGDAAHAGRKALERHACRGCHVIPGVVGSARHVGPPLDAYARRSTIAGRWPNDAEHLARFIRAPQHLRPGGAMPALGVDAADARAMAAYLLTLH